MNINLLIEIILILFAILSTNGIIYNLSKFNFNKKNFTENISVIRNKSEKKPWIWTYLIAFIPMNVTPSNVPQILDVDSSEADTYEDIYDINNFFNIEINGEITTPYQDYVLLNESTLPSDFESVNPSLDSLTVLNEETFYQWWEIVMDLHDHPINSPANVLQQIKFEELNILYSQDLIEYAITQTELRLIIELFPAMDLFKPDINHVILTVMSLFH
jgi:hypothetical protein